MYGSVLATPRPSSHEVTGLLHAWRAGDERALATLIPLVHADLRRLARRQMAGERSGHTLQPTALVNEVFLRLVDLRRIHWQDRAHFLSMAARLASQILVDHARVQGSRKRGGRAHHAPVDTALAAPDRPLDDVVAVDRALGLLAAHDERKARVVELRVFGGLTVRETAAVLEVSPETVKRDWRFARAWLVHELAGGSAGRVRRLG